MKLANAFFFAFSCYGASMMSGGYSSNGVWVNYETRLEPSTPPVINTGGGTLSEQNERNTIKRHLCNLDNHTYSGYDLVVTPLADGRFELRFGPLTITPQKMSEIFSNVPNWTQLPLPSAPVTMQVWAGETVALDLFVNHSTGQKITDYLTVKGRGQNQSPVEGPARDFSPEDADIVIVSPQLKVDGKLVTSSRGGISGQAVWIDVPAQGRFVFSLVPHPELGMQSAGEIRGSVMTWHSEGHEYSITTDRQIASGSHAYNLYLFHVSRLVEQFRMAAGRKPDAAIRGQ